MAIKRKYPEKGFGSLPCPKCGATTSIDLSLENLCTFHCISCRNVFGTRDVEAFIDSWTPVLDWLARPVREPKPSVLDRLVALLSQGPTKPPSVER